VVAVERSLEAIAAVPGVTHVGGATGLPLVTAQRGTSFEVEGRSDMAADQRSAYFIAASPGYFRTLRTTIVGGREFDAKDTGRSQLVVVISKTLERRFFPHGDAVGRRLRLVNPEQSGEWRTIVGVAGDVRYQGLEDVDPAVVYTPFAQTPFPWIYVEVRATGDPMALLGSIRHAVKSVNTKLPVANPQMMTSFVTQGSADPRFRTTLVALFAAAGMLLAAVGLHGVVAFGVARRAREIAIRLALGASMASVRRRVVVQSMMLALAGVAAGLVAAVWMGGLLSGLLYETAPTDPAALAAVVVVLLIVAIAASVVPARRATRIQPVEALRDV
jgi:predicted permease